MRAPRRRDLSWPMIFTWCPIECTEHLVCPRHQADSFGQVPWCQIQTGNISGLLGEGTRPQRAAIHPRKAHEDSRWSWDTWKHTRDDKGRKPRRWAGDMSRGPENLKDLCAQLPPTFLGKGSANGAPVTSVQHISHVRWAAVTACRRPGCTFTLTTRLLTCCHLTPAKQGYP